MCTTGDCTYVKRWFVASTANVPRPATTVSHQILSCPRHSGRIETEATNEFPVTVLFDSWYASNKLLKFCRRQGWHVICAIKSNRLLDGVKLSQWNQRLKHQPYTRVKPAATDRRKRPYLVRARQGRLKNVPFEVCVLISKRHRGDKRPKYFMCTDLSLSTQKILRFYQKRWPIEVDNYYVKQFLGLGDFRVQSYEAVQKWFAVVFLAYTFLQWRLNHARPEEQFATVADVIRHHRQEHARHVLRAACESVEWRDVKRVFEQFIGQIETGSKLSKLFLSPIVDCASG